MFRLENNVPEVYVKESRDFQLFLRLYDLTNNAVRFNIKSIDNLLNPHKCIDRILPLLCTRVGFFPKSSYNSYALREIICAFPTILKYKGSKKSIQVALNAILKAENNHSISLINIDPERSEVSIYTEKAIINQNLLEDVLSYTLPTGFVLNIGRYEIAPTSDTKTNIEGTDYTSYYTNDSKNISTIISVQYAINNASGDLSKTSLGNYLDTEVISTDVLNSNSQASSVSNIGDYNE